MKSANIPYLPQVDHLRALAAVWIVLYHGMRLIGVGFQGRMGDDPSNWERTSNPFFALLVEGHTAVALFMVLSGFIFTHGALGKRVLYGPFVVNRLLRIYPLYLAVGLWVLTARSSTSGPSLTLEILVATLLPVGDLKWSSPVEVVPMAWAVAVEFQFYLLFPLLMARFNDRPLRVAGAVIGTAFLFRAVAVFNGAGPRDLVYWHLLGRIDQFVLGMVAALAYARLGKRAAVAALVAGGPVVVATLFAFHQRGGWPNDEAWKIVWPTAEGAAWAVFVFGYVGAGPGRPGWLSRPVAAVGEVSFSIYLLHQLIVMPVAYRAGGLPRPTGDPSLDAVFATVVFVLPVVIVLSLLTYRVIEKPFLAMRRKYLVEPPATPPAG